MNIMTPRDALDALVVYYPHQRQEFNKPAWTPLHLTTSSKLSPPLQEHAVGAPVRRAPAEVSTILRRTHMPVATAAVDASSSEEEEEEEEPVARGASTDSQEFASAAPSRMPSVLTAYASAASLDSPAQRDRVGGQAESAASSSQHEDEDGASSVLRPHAGPRAFAAPALGQEELGSSPEKRTGLSFAGLSAAAWSPVPAAGRRAPAGGLFAGLMEGLAARAKEVCSPRATPEKVVGSMCESMCEIFFM